LIIQAEKKRTHKHICCLHICNAHTHTWFTLPHFHKQYTLRTSLHPYPTHKPTHKQSYKRTCTIHTCPTPTYLHYIPTYLHYPTNLQNPTYLPYPCIPTLHLQPLHPTLQTGPIITHQLQDQAVRWCGCVLAGTDMISVAHQRTSPPYIQTYTQVILQTHLYPTYLPVSVFSMSILLVMQVLSYKTQRDKRHV